MNHRSLVTTSITRSVMPRTDIGLTRKPAAPASRPARTCSASPLAVSRNTGRRGSGELGRCTNRANQIEPALIGHLPVGKHHIRWGRHDCVVGGRRAFDNDGIPPVAIVKQLSQQEPGQRVIVHEQKLQEPIILDRHDLGIDQRHRPCDQRGDRALSQRRQFLSNTLCISGRSGFELQGQITQQGGPGIPGQTFQCMGRTRGTSAPTRSHRGYA